ncbi:aromatic amino acid hydroxylase [Luminiphilus sp.]|nr:aromatic amino acid hydroxylase [Luminiphilus sp.]
MMKQQEIIESLPLHLRPFVTTQRYGDYTPQDQAAWRFIMKHLVSQLTHTAHPAYLQGLARTGITRDRIPAIEEMNECLRELGWQAVVVDGFIPPAIFMEFQALKVLVIALEMRSAKNLFYTPAPDIVHESAGHAPFIVDTDYAEFLQRFGEVGMKAVATKADLEQYEAVRQLSILKESPDATEVQIAEAESALMGLYRRDDMPSEAALLTRLHWWTVEYGLVGSPEDYKIFGAGILSSLGESCRCLDDEAVRKIPLTVNAINTPYDITTEQPQLFVTQSCKHLTQVLEDFAASMCFMKGGAESIKKAIQAESLCTAQYDSGLQVSGKFKQVLCDAVGNAIYLRTEGATQIAYQDTELSGHGVETHATGFGSPVGRLKGLNKCLSRYSVDELKTLGIRVGSNVTLEYLSGITVKGVLRDIVRCDQHNLLLSFEGCSVNDLNGTALFSPEWGTYDLAVGSTITSVYGGVADREKLQLFEPVARSQKIKATQDEGLMNAYGVVDQLRSSRKKIGAGELPDVVEKALRNHTDEWLIRTELLDVVNSELHSAFEMQLHDIADRRPEAATGINMALKAASH